MQEHRPSTASPSPAQLRLYLILISAVYLVGTLYLADSKPLWYDELFTFYITGQGGPERIWAALRAGLDPNPPLIYVATYTSQWLFGTGHIASRLPATLGFLLLMISIYRFASLRLPTPFALQAMVLVALTGAYEYAYEARAYGLMVGLAAFTLSCWQRRQPGAVAAALSLTLLTHCYSILILPPLFVGELVRLWFTRKLERPMAAALILPCVIIVGYFPLLQSTHKISLVGPIFDPSVPNIIRSYLEIVVPLLLPVLATLALIGATSLRRVKVGATFEVHEWAALGVLALVPVTTFVISSVMHGGYFTRYCLLVAIPMAIGVAWASFAASGVGWRHAKLLPPLILTYFVGSVIWEGRMLQPRNPAAEMSSLLPQDDRPLVIADGQTFLQLDHYLDSATAARVVFLMDHDAAMRYMGTDCYDAAMRNVAPWFPLRGRLIPYDEFMAQRKPFLVYGTSEATHAWLWSRLKDESISVKKEWSKRGLQLVSVTP